MTALQQGGMLGETSKLLPQMGSTGSVAIWRSEVAALCVGNALLTACVSLAFVGPLLDLIGEPTIGIHLCTSAPDEVRCLQGAAASVWGHPERIYRWRAAAADMKGITTGANSMFLSLDQVEAISTPDLRRVLKMLSFKTAKKPARGNVGLPASQPWRGVILSAGIESISTHLARSRGRPMHREVLDIDISANTFARFGQFQGSANSADLIARLSAATLQSHGAAGEAFQVRLAAMPKGQIAILRRTLDAIYREIIAKYHLLGDATAIEAARKCALIALAGELAMTFDLTGWSRGAAREAAGCLLTAWMTTREAERVTLAAASVTPLCAFLQSEAQNLLDEGGTLATVENGWKDENFFYLTSEAWKSVHGKRARKAARELADAGFLVPEDDVNLSHHGPKWIPGRPRVYWIPREIIDLTEEALEAEVGARISSRFPHYSPIAHFSQNVAGPS